MRHLIGLAVLVAAGVALVATPAGAPILGLDHDRFAQAAIAVALVVWLASAFGARLGAAGVARIVASALIWAALIVGLTGLYAYRYEFSDIADRVMAEIDPSQPVVGAGGEVTIARRLGGEFVISAKANGVSTAFLFDTGASTVVLRAGDARRMGIDLARLDYDVGVTTANGAARAAETVVAQIAIGPIVVRNVRALVARPGALNESLLGMSFLEKLKSYSVERGRLVLKGR